MLDSMQGVRRGGKVVNVGGVADDLPIDVKWLMDEQIQIIGSNWFTAAQGQEMADMFGPAPSTCRTWSTEASRWPK